MPADHANQDPLSNPWFRRDLRLGISQPDFCLEFRYPRYAAVILDENIPEEA
jgi:hypothetical protein